MHLTTKQDGKLMNANNFPSTIANLGNVKKRNQQKKHRPTIIKTNDQ